IETQKLEFKESAKPKVGSMDKVKHKPGGGDVRVLHAPMRCHALARVRSLQNIHHQPAGGNVQILDEKVDFTEKAKPKVGSMDKVKHTPGGGDKK
ncbi:TAU-like protein, partial [Mya arenaria]